MDREGNFPILVPGFRRSCSVEWRFFPWFTKGFRAFLEMEEGMEMMEIYGKSLIFWKEYWLDLIFPHLFSDPEDFPFLRMLEMGAKSCEVPVEMVNILNEFTRVWEASQLVPDSVHKTLQRSPAKKLDKQNRQNVHSESQTHKTCVWLFRFGQF